MKLYFDGSCGPNNPGGYACYAYVVMNEDECIIKQTGVECEGKEATNNVAEYAGLKHGLQYLLDNEITNKVEIFGDSKLVISQINGDWKCKQTHLQLMLKDVKALLDRFDYWEASWVPRNENSLADGLSKWQSVING